MMDEQILQQYVNSCDIEIPPEQLEDEISAMICEMQCKRRYESLANGISLFYSQNEIEQQMEEIREQATLIVKTRLVIQKIIEERHIVVTREELEKEAYAIAKRQKISMSLIKDFFGPNFGLLEKDLNE